MKRSMVKIKEEGNMNRSMVKIYALICMLSLVFSSLALSTVFAEPIGQESILTGNTFTTNDITNFYPEPMIQTGATYTWVADESDSLLLTNDPSNNKLFNGQILNQDPDHMVSGGWDAIDGTIIIDLKANYYISQADVWTKYTQPTQASPTTSIRYMESFDVEISTDGSNYTNICTTHNNGNTESNSNTLVKTVGEFDNVKARYVKIKMKQSADSKQLAVGEVMLFGYLNKDDLYALIEEANNLVETDYAADSWLVFRNVLIAGQTVADNTVATQIEIDNAVTNLQSAIDRLVPFGAVVKSALKNKILSVYSLVKEHYTNVSWEDLRTQLLQARTVYLNPDLNQQVVDSATANLQQAINNLQYVATQGILTNNTFNPNVDPAEYINAQKYQTSLAYSYVSGETNTQIMDNDSNRTKLLGGDVNNNNPLYIADSSWAPGSNQYIATIIFEFGSPCYINRVDLWTRYTKSSLRQMDYFDVEVSTDGINYNKVATANNNIHITNIDFVGYVNTTANFELVKAKYVKLKAHNRSGSQQVVLSEVIMFGYPASGATTPNYALTNVSCTGAGGTEGVISLSEATELNISAVAANNTPQAKDITTITALYDPNGKLVAFDSESLPVSAGGGTKRYTLQLTGLPTDISDNYTLKTFIWSSLADCEPLTSVRRFGEIE